MSTYQRPGVYVQETLNPIQQIVGPASTSIAAFLGENDRGPIVPTLVNSWSDYVTKFGSWNTTANNNLAIAVYQFFINGGSSAYVTRVVGAGSAAATRVLSDRAGSPAPTLVVNAINVGAWGNSLNVSISDSTSTGLFNIVIKYNGVADSNIVERFTDLSMDPTNARYALSVINVSSKYVVVADAGSSSTGATRNPAVSSNLSLTSGLNGAAAVGGDIVASLPLYDTIAQSLILNAPGYSDAATVNDIISYAEGREDIFVVIDGSTGSVASQISLNLTYDASSYAAVYYPPIYINDPTTGVGGAQNATKLIGAGSSVIGLFARTDASRGVFKAPAGLSSRITGAVSVTALTNAELDSLNISPAPVNAIKFVSGSGIVVMGSRTLKAGYVDKYVPVRRTLIYLRKSLTDLTQFAVFEPNDPALWRRLNATISTFLTEFWSQGGLKGSVPSEAFFIKVDDTNNTTNTIDNGEVNIEVGVSLQRPAEYVVIKIGQFDGGTTVTVA
jgi:phage tail sheath protein FI